jgi:ribonuclease HIII
LHFLTMTEDPRLIKLKAAITARGWRWKLGKPIQYGTQLVVDDGASEVTIDFYPKRGRTVVGGATSPLRGALSELAGTLEGAVAAQPRPSGAPGAAPPLPEAAELGMDESGKGDWFGPLVVAAVFVEPSAAPALRGAGVRDSKELLPGELARVAVAIEAVIPAGARHVLALAPAEYNRRYAPLANINLLLAELYAETAAPVAASTGATTIVCDQFAQRAERLDTAFARAGLPRPRQLHHAEATSIAVAAASILAAARFQAELVRLGREAGLGGPLPRGASAIADLRRAARAIIGREGPAGLGNYAKLNFKPVRELLQGTGDRG